MNLFTEEQVTQFILDNPIRTDGALTEYLISIDIEDDGDSYSRVTLPFWFQNEQVVTDVLSFLTKAHALGAQVYLRNGEAVVDFFHSVCDPD